MDERGAQDPPGAKDEHGDTDRPGTTDQSGSTDPPGARTRAAAASPLDVAAVRREFPILDAMTYLNSAANGLVPERARRSMEAFFSNYEYLEGLAREDVVNMLDDTRAQAAQLLACKPESIALTFNTSHGLNIAALALAYAPGDNVVLAQGEFPANVYPWRNLERRGVELRMLETPDSRAHVDLLLAACDERTRVVTVSALQFHDGYRPDIDTLARECRRRGIRTVVDGIQAIGSCVVRPLELDVDFMATGGQKWLLAPRGTGFLYVREALLEATPPPIPGWLNVDYEGRFDDLLRYPTELLPDARRFELGTPNLHDIRMLRESLRFLNELGIENIAHHNAALAQRMRDELQALGALRVVDPGPRPSPLVVFSPQDAGRVQTLRTALANAHVHCAFRQGRFRLAFHLYNDASDVERVLEVVRRS
jgi:selenocysteine lyase/cysteine desulfurase